MARAVLLGLVHAVADSGLDLTHTHPEVQCVMKVSGKLVRQIQGCRRQEVHILRHARRTDVQVHGLRAEHGHVLPPSAKLENRGVNARQGNGLLHMEFRCREHESH